jgi:hypothetical protein
MKLKTLKYFVIIFFILPLNVFCQKVYECNNGVIQFNSNATQELIKASSKVLSGILNTQDKTFAFLVKISSFEGFNAALQREHFNEKYMESDKYADATFWGKIIEDIDFSKEGIYQVRAKGILKIHNIEQERIIKSTIKIGNGKIAIKSDFNVLLKDHDIKVPKVVHEKIATEINVTIEAELHPAKEEAH